VPKRKLRCEMANLYERFSMDRAHAEHVADLCDTVFLELPHLHGLTKTCRRLVQMTALLHDIGEAGGKVDHAAGGARRLRRTRIPWIPSGWKPIIAQAVELHSTRSDVGAFLGRVTKERTAELALAGRVAAILRIGDGRPSADPLVMTPRLESTRGRQGSGQPPAVLEGLCDFGHQGLLHDREFGLIHNRARMLNTTHGRFMQRDPLQYSDGMNLYQYVRSQPVSVTDPSGLLSPDIELVQWWIKTMPSVDSKTKFMLKQLKQKNVKMYTKNSWVWHYDGEKGYIWIDCDFNGLTQATGWYEDGMREWAKNNKDGSYRQIVRDYALDVKAKGGDAVKVLADTYDFAHKWTKYPSGEPSGDMMDYKGFADATMWAFADRSLSSGKTKAGVNVTNQGSMSKFFYDFANEQARPAEDQTHHFAAYFTLGATVSKPNVIGGGVAFVTNDTPVNNPGDYLLAVVGVNLGQSYRQNPRYIGAEITQLLQTDPAMRDGTPANKQWNAAIHYATIYLGGQ